MITQTPKVHHAWSVHMTLRSYPYFYNVYKLIPLDTDLCHSYCSEEQDRHCDGDARNPLCLHHDDFNPLQNMCTDKYGVDRHSEVPSNEHYCTNPSRQLVMYILHVMKTSYIQVRMYNR